MANHLKVGGITREQKINLKISAEEALKKAKERTKNYIPVRISQRLVVFVPPSYDIEKIKQKYKHKEPKHLW
ncbi:MAG: hypothetical protein R3Y28_08945 [Candidatus Gastranaerophilales bacterium]